MVLTIHASDNARMLWNRITTRINMDDIDTEQEYDVVIDALQEKRDRLWKMTQQNMNADMYNIMDQIRLEQIDQLDRAMASWKKSKE
jgi:hypothetical protein